MYDDEFDDDLDNTIRCNECGKDFYEDSISCPHCGWLVVEDLGPWSNKPSWMRWVGVISILLVISALAWPAVQFVKLLWR